MYLATSPLCTWLPNPLSPQTACASMIANSWASVPPPPPYSSGTEAHSRPSRSDTDMLANSEHEMKAVEHGLYRPMAEHMMASRGAVRDMTTPAPEAARAIVDAILDHDGPLRYGCDPMSVGMLDAWRHSNDEDMMLNMLKGRGM